MGKDIFETNPVMQANSKKISQCYPVTAFL